MNGISLTNADHREAVRVVKESKGALGIVRGGREGEGGREGGRGKGMEGRIDGGRRKKGRKMKNVREGREGREGRMEGI